MAGRSVRRGKKGIGFTGCRAAVGDGADHQRLSRAQIACAWKCKPAHIQCAQRLPFAPDKASGEYVF